MSDVCRLTVLPRFAEPVNNVTVVAGRDATLHCVVDNLQKFKVIITIINSRDLIVYISVRKFQVQVDIR